MSKLTNILIFTTGVSIGSVVTWKLLKTKYEQIAREEIDSVKEIYRNKTQKIDDNTTDNYKRGARQAFEQGVEDAKEYASIIKENGYSTKYSEMSKKKKEEKEIEDVEKPYVIPPEEFGIYDDYDTISLTYYSDGAVADDDDEIMEKDDVDAAIGLDALNHFGEFDDDSVFVRNDKRKVDYEILLDNRAYSDVLKSKPYLKED